MTARPRNLRTHTVTTADVIESLAWEHDATVQAGAGWMTLDLGQGIKLCAPLPAIAPSGRSVA